MSVHRQRLRQVLLLPLDRLIVTSDQVLPRPEQMEEWSLPPGDRAALSRWGLPVVDDCQLCGGFQPGTDPAMMVGGRQLYSLGLLAGLEVGADTATGAVWGISGAPGVPDSFVNSSVANFVEAAWRWYGAWPEIKQLRHSIEQFGLLDDFLAFVVELDAACEKADVSFWREYVESW